MSLSDIINELNNLRINNTDSESESEEMTFPENSLQMLRMFVDTIPNFDGNFNTLPSFISSCDYLFDTFNTSEETIKRYLLRVVQTKLVGRAQLLVGCRTELNSWSLIKNALEQCFGDNRSLECLEQDLFLASPNRNESPLDFGKRLQILRSTLAQKLSISDSTPEVKVAMMKQYDGICLRAFVRGLSGPLQTVIRLKNPSSLEEAMAYIIEEENFQYTQNIFKFPNHSKTPGSNTQNSYSKPQTKFGHSNNNYRNQAPNQNFHYQKFQAPHQSNFQQSYRPPQTFPADRNRNNFPSQPINIQSRNNNFQKRYPTNQEVFGPPRNTNVFKPRGTVPHNSPQPMSVSTTNTYKPNYPQRQNHFQPSGPRNFIAEELYQIDDTQNDERYETEQPERTRNPKPFSKTQNVEAQHASVSSSTNYESDPNFYYKGQGTHKT
ncbi:unnamed protein product [Acanthoscelides obtectus]|uniref:Uncharacterized protein n=1 Tax=Acanthoscelides obtectus TaxID=200917 RepID=A0A9P0LTH7_ACAOB|nr:unnamed protein product [Acanthoscelides obtectus]CAK1624021.1 Retrovirus-related Gag polyprotein from transposon HMS-Beagle [Acanthoscelides obtectus]